MVEASTIAEPSRQGFFNRRPGCEDMAGTSWKLPKARPNGPPYFSRNQVSTALHQMAVLLELNGANMFRTRSYQNGSRLIGSLAQDLGELVASGELFDLKGIGKGLGSAITQAVGDGNWPEEWVELHEKTPPGLIEMLGIPGVGPKKIKLLSDELGVMTVADLQEVCVKNEVAPLKGFGAKSQQRILDGIDLLARFSARRRLDIGLRYGHTFLNMINEIPGIQKAELAGSARRRRETIGDLDIVAAVNPSDIDTVSQNILSLAGIADVKGAGGSKISVILDTSIFEEGFSLGHLDANVLDAIGGQDYEQLESGGTIDAQVRLVPPSVFPFTLAYFTGSKEHNIRMRKIAQEKGLKLNEFGLMPETELTGLEAAATSLSAIDEAEIYGHLGLDFVVPELREDMGEIEAAQNNELPNLLKLSDVKGSLHNHTTLSDGEASLEEMADTARRMGWSWLGIADHSPTLMVANGASAEDLLSQHEKMQVYNQDWKNQGVDFRLFSGVESDILENGKLDHPDDVLSKIDYVVASVHAMGRWASRDESQNTEDLLKCLDHEATTVLGHPTGRILQGRDGYEVDLHRVLEHMAEYNADGVLKAVELNASPYRLDLDWRLCKRAKELGVPVVINPDAHSTSGLGDIDYGVMVGRKGWLESADVLNSLSAEQMNQRLLGVD
ncbi:MAG TPA: DNA polymerase/3'-5' exonuclease PolX [Candidatus Poseidoniales archaeon]|nr:MAG: DNA polymerase/3'-5' exonuclease PolX [Euryarchaeota archaeon]HIF45872.1 DNA polymerase/3'-5' exonuclease PolX [Candidatus Poseidoniales archaeon]HIL65017.1 DNA polymerase/3'-5' exonuclease PolX [Candidatus Poseidoniales archaeon]